MSAETKTTWTSLENAVATYGLETSLILKWVDDGLIQAEHPDTRWMRVRSDDLVQKINHENMAKQDFLAVG